MWYFLLKFAKKATVSAIPGIISGAFAGPELLEAFQGGVAEGAVPAARELGVILGGAVGGIVQWLAAYIPRNEPARK